MTPPEQARAARLTAIAEIRARQKESYWVPHEGTNTSAMLNDVWTLLAHVETLTQQVAQDGVAFQLLRQENARLTARCQVIAALAATSLGTAEQARDTAHAALRED